MRNLKKVLALVLALVMAMSLMVTAGATSLSDYKDSGSVTAKYATAVDVATQLGVLRGMGDDVYAPQGTLTRAQLATMIYRITTGDVTDSRVGSFAGGAAASFTDTPATAWYAGYVGYSADAGYLKGMGDGTYAPDSALTGYQALAALLRGIGYNEEGHNFCGPDWTVEVAKVASETGMLENISGDVDLNKAITREVAAQLVYNALFIRNVGYTSAFGYQPAWNKDDLATDIFGIVTDKDGKTANDIWGRPSTVWKTSKKVVVSIAAEPVATHNVATSQCQIATDLGVKDKTFSVDVYTNGVLAVESFSATATKATEGAQGTLIEVYQVGDTNRLVVIDTYLAQVTAVNEATYDAAGHEKTPATTDLAVYFNTRNTTVPMTLEGTDYAKGDYILVNVNVSDGNGKAVAADKYTVEAVQVAKTFVGAQTKIWTNAAQHTIDGTEYDDAAHFYLDAAGKTKTENFTWFLDQYGNVIGNVAIDRTSYAVLKDIIWNVGKPGYAEATLVYMDGSEKTVTVNTLDGIGIGSILADYRTPGWNLSADNRPTTLNDNIASLFVFGGVSTDSSLNASYEGCALYRVYTNDDGTVRLDGFERGMNEGKGYYVAYDEDAVIDTGSSRILDLDDASAPGGYVYITEDTEILVREGSAGDYTYAAYNINNVPDFEDNTEIFYTYETVNGKDIATRVYVKNGVVEAELGDHLFVTTDNYYRVAGDPMTYVMNVVIDGVERQIQTNIDNIKILAENEGKLFHVEWATDPDEGYYGFVDELRLINEEEDDDYDYDDPFCDYLTGDTAISGNRILGAEESYTITSDTVVVGAADLSKVDFDKQGVWVVASWNGKYNVADEVYVGEKLDESVALTVTAKTGTVTVDKDDATKITVISKEDANADVLTLTANDENSVIVGGDKSLARKEDTLNISTQTSSPVTIKVSNEAGTIVDKPYTITLKWTNDVNEGLITRLTDFTNQETVTYKGNGDAYSSIALALNNVKSVDRGTATSVQLWLKDTATSVQYRNFTTTANIDCDLIDQEIIGTGEIKLANPGEFTVVEITTDGTPWYAVFQVK